MSSNQRCPADAQNLFKSYSGRPVDKLRRGNIDIIYTGNKKDEETNKERYTNNFQRPILLYFIQKVRLQVDGLQALKIRLKAFRPSLTPEFFNERRECCNKIFR